VTKDRLFNQRELKRNGVGPADLCYPKCPKQDPNGGPAEPPFSLSRRYSLVEVP
jgi:hypothetical protein